MINMKLTVWSGSNNDPRYDLNQIDLITAISNEICRQHPKIKAEPRLFNAIIAAADMLVDEYAKPNTPASDGMGLTAWLACDDVGRSSKYMAWLLNKDKFSQPEFGFPNDADDFGRCVRMTSAIGISDDEVAELLGKESGRWLYLGSVWKEMVLDYKEGRIDDLNGNLDEFWD